MTGPGYMVTALGELGVRETAGDADNPRVIAYHKACDDTVAHDAVPWCSSFVNFVMLQHGLARTKSRAARSWLTWGEAFRVPRYGAVTVIRRGDEAWMGHVGFLIDASDDALWILGGNQNDQVSIARYSATRLLGWRWPVDA